MTASKWVWNLETIASGKQNVIAKLQYRNAILSISPRFHLFVFDVNQGNEEAG